MEKLTIQHIAPYLPYGLKIQHKNDIYEVTALSKDNIYFKGGLIQISDENTKPHLFHISCLTNTIQHEGTEFIPIVELAKTAYPSSSRNFVLEGKYAIDTTSDLAFGFDDKDFESFDTNSARIKPTFNQYQLFQKLAEWHINFVGIPEGLYIDKNTLK